MIAREQARIAAAPIADRQTCRPCNYKVTTPITVAITEDATVRKGFMTGVRRHRFRKAPPGVPRKKKLQTTGAYETLRQVTEPEPLLAFENGDTVIAV